MSNTRYKIAVSVQESTGHRPNELARTMAPHPLIYQEIPYQPTYFVYNRRLSSGSMNHLSADETYWRTRRSVIMRHTGELCDTPMYDQKREIPRGKLVDIPKIPSKD